MDEVMRTVVWKMTYLTCVWVVPECTVTRCKMACICRKGGPKNPVIRLVSYGERYCTDFCHFDCGCPVW